MAVLAEVELVLAGLDAAEWQKALARSLAEAMDESPNASIAKELRLLMVELGASADEKPKGDTSDDLASKRAARRAAAG